MDKKWKIGLAFPNLPYLISGHFSLTETSAIMKYLCERHKPELLGETPEERGLSMMVENVLMEVQKAFSPCYTTDDKEAVIKGVTEKFKPVVEYLGDKHFIIGNKISWVDFYLFEFTCKFA